MSRRVLALTRLFVICTAHMLWREDHEHTTPCLGIICRFSTFSASVVDYGAWGACPHSSQFQLPGARVESSEFYFAFWARSSRSPRRSLVWWPEWSRFFWSRSTVRSERQRLTLCTHSDSLSRASLCVETLRDKSPQRAAERVCVACCIVHSRI